MTTSRRYDLDWLRVLAFLILIYFHAAIAFIPGGLPLIQNAEVSQGLDLFVTISAQFRLALLFFISGLGVAFARKNKSTREYLLERSKRLLIPLIVGITLIVPPMVYTEKLFMGAFDGSFLDFYPQFYLGGIYPKGNLSWHHFWFIVYLYLFCLLGIKAFKILDNKQNNLPKKAIQSLKGRGIYTFILPLFVVEVCLRAFFPGFRDLIHDWASFFQWFLVFLAGYVFANHLNLLNSATRLRHWSFVGAITSIVLMFILFGGMHLNEDPRDEWLFPKYLLFCAVRVTIVWTCILSCLGYAGKHLQFTNGVLRYVTEAVYPLFILHLTFITILGYWVVSLEWNLWSKYLFITSGTVFLVLASYHFLIRPFNIMRVLFGVKPIVRLSKHSTVKHSEKTI